MDQKVDDIVSDLSCFELVGLAWRVTVRGHTVSGNRGRCSIDSSRPIREDQQWHWGSCAKALTTTTIACILEKEPELFPGKWDTTVGSVLKAHLPADSHINEITLLQLAHHRSGLLPDLDLDEENALYEQVRSLSLPERRRAYSARVAEKPLVHAPGSKYGPYSNAAYVVMASVVETACGSTWEELVVSLVTRPLGMSSFGFGTPHIRSREGDGDTEEADVVGHDEDGKAYPHLKDLPWMYSAFSVHSTLEDWEKFATYHLRALREDSSFLSENPLNLSQLSIKMLHTPGSPAFPDEPFDGRSRPLGYAMGWKTEWEDITDKEELRIKSEPTGLLWHMGTNFLFRACILIDSRRDIVALLATNSGSCVSALALRLALEKMIQL